MASGEFYQEHNDTGCGALLKLSASFPWFLIIKVLSGKIKEASRKNLTTKVHRKMLHDFWLNFQTFSPNQLEYKIFPEQNWLGWQQKVPMPAQCPLRRRRVSLILHCDGIHSFVTRWNPTREQKHWCFSLSLIMQHVKGQDSH